MGETRDITKEFIFWLPVKGYEGLYLVSEYGDVYTIRTQTIRVQATDKKGYKKLTLSKDGITKNHFVHRLVAYAFIPEVSGKTLINHLDEDPTNNHFTNLAWCTPSENVRWGNCISKNRNAHINHPSSSKQILAFDNNGNLVYDFPSANEAERRLGIDACTIRDHLKNKRKRKEAGGYIWRYKCECLPQEKSG